MLQIMEKKSLTTVHIKPRAKRKVTLKMYTNKFSKHLGAFCNSSMQPYGKICSRSWDLGIGSMPEKHKESEFRIYGTWIWCFNIGNKMRNWNDAD